MSDAATIVSLLLAGTLAGNELGTWAVIHPALARLPLEHEVPAEQAVTRRYGLFMPVLMSATIIAAFTTAGMLDGSARTMMLLAGGCYAAMLAITFVGNVPINIKTLRFEGDDERSWRAMRRRWDRLHTLRIVLDVGGLALIAAAAVKSG